MNVFMKNAKDLEIIDNLNGKEYYRVDKLGTITASVVQVVKTPTTPASETITEQELQGQSPEPTVIERQILTQIFVAHGKNKKSLEQLRL